MLKKNNQEKIIYKTQEYERVGILPPEEVLPHIKNNLLQLHKERNTVLLGYPLHTQSNRLRTFLLTGLNCVYCNIQGNYFAIERTKGNVNYHLNLWAKKEDGTHVLMTHDHILARGLGGEDNIETNTTTMCGPCNWKKGTLENQLIQDPYNIELQKKINKFKG